MKKALIITCLCFLGLSLAIFFAAWEILHYAKVNSNLQWGPEPRAVKVLSASEVPFNVFFGFDGGATGNSASMNSAHHYYRAKAHDDASGASLHWKLNCDQAIQAPITMTYTPYGEASMPRLEIHAVVGGPYRDEQEATASQGGSIPADEELQKFSGVMEGGFGEESVYVLQRASIVAGNDFRTADPDITPYSGQREVQFTLTNEAGDRFYDYTSKNVGHSMAVVMGGRIREVAVIKDAIRYSGVIQGSFSPEEVTALSKLLRTGAKQRAENYGSLSGAGISTTQNHCSVSADDEFNFLRWLTR